MSSFSDLTFSTNKPSASHTLMNHSYNLKDYFFHLFDLLFPIHLHILHSDEYLKYAKPSCFEPTEWKALKPPLTLNHMKSNIKCLEWPQGFPWPTVTDLL